MSEAKRYDAIVIGGGTGGLVAAAYLALAGRSVLVLEAKDTLGGRCSASAALCDVRVPLDVHGFFALDARMLQELSLTQRGLRFAVRDLPTVGLRPDGKHLILGRDAHAAARAVAAQSPADAKAYESYRKEMFSLARALRPRWQESGEPIVAPRREPDRRLFARLAQTGAADLLNAWFESEAVKTTLAFDSVSPFEPGSALVLLWRAAQEMCGLQGAVAVPQGGTAAFAGALIAAVQEAGAEIRTKARVRRLLLGGNTAAGVALETGEEIFARTVLSSLSRHHTLLELAPTASAGFAQTHALRNSAHRVGTASIMFLLNAPPRLGGEKVTAAARFVLAERIESFRLADRSARAGRLPDELVLEAMVPTAIEPSLAPAGQHLLSVRIFGLPLTPQQGWPALSQTLADRVISALEPHTTQLRARIVGMDIRLPDQASTPDAAVSNTRLLASYDTRIETSVEGLYLCGAAAEPMDAVSGRAGRLAAGIAAARLGGAT